MQFPALYSSLGGVSDLDRAFLNQLPFGVKEGAVGLLAEFLIVNRYDAAVIRLRGGGVTEVNIKGSVRNAEDHLVAPRQSVILADHASLTASWSGTAAVGQKNLAIGKLAQMRRSTRSGGNALKLTPGLTSILTSRNTGLQMASVLTQSLSRYATRMVPERS